MDWAALVAQVPIVAAFIWFTLQMQARYSASLEKRDELFQKSLQEQADQWRGFFISLNEGNKADVCELAALMKDLTTSVHRLSMDLASHDRHVDDRIRATAAIATQPVKKTKTPRSNE